MSKSNGVDVKGWKHSKIGRIDRKMTKVREYIRELDPFRTWSIQFSRGQEDSSPDTLSRAIPKVVISDLDVQQKQQCTALFSRGEKLRSGFRGGMGEDRPRLEGGGQALPLSGARLLSSAASSFG